MGVIVALLVIVTYGGWLMYCDIRDFSRHEKPGPTPSLIPERNWLEEMAEKPVWSRGFFYLDPDGVKQYRCGVSRYDRLGRRASGYRISEKGLV